MGTHLKASGFVRGHARLNTHIYIYIHIYVYKFKVAYTLYYNLYESGKYSKERHEYDDCYAQLQVPLHHVHFGIYCLCSSLDGN